MKEQITVKLSLAKANAWLKGDGEDDHVYEQIDKAVADYEGDQERQGAQSREGHCPTCDSPKPHLHPAVQHEGEVQPCGDSFHTPGRGQGCGQGG